MKNDKIFLRATLLEKALTALERVATQLVDSERSQIDATIQRFEFTIELFWKYLKAILEEKGVEVYYPKDVLKAAYKGGLIEEEEIWLAMLMDRNQTSHTYDEALADKIYHRIQGYVPVFRQTLNKLTKEIKDF